MARYELVRVSAELVEELLAQEPQPVVLVGLERFEDGTVELVFRTPPDGVGEGVGSERASSRAGDYRRPSARREEGAG